MSALEPQVGNKVRRSDAVKAAKNDLNYLRLLCTPQYPDPFPDIYVAIFQLVVANIDKPEYWERFVLALPRGHLKTTFIEMITVWVITFTNLQSYLIVANTIELSEGMLASIMDHLSSENYVALFGDWREGKVIDNARTKEFYLFDRLIRLHATYSMGKVRGGKRVERYQLFLIDDAFNREDADSPAKFLKFIEWLNGTCLKGRNAKRAIAIYAGNKYPTKQCVVSKLAETKAWRSVIVGAIQADGTALMPNIRSLESLLQEFEDDEDLGLADSFLSEMLNGKSSGLRSGIDIGKMPPPVDDYEWAHWSMPPWGRMLIVDPATDKETLDQVAIGVLELYPDDVDIYTHIEENKLPHDELAAHIVELAMVMQIPLIVYEDVGFQHILGREIRSKLEDMGIYQVAVMPITPRGMNKLKRIRNFMLKYITPTYIVEEDKTIPTRILFRAEARSVVIGRLEMFDITKANNVDDVLDMIAYGTMAKHDQAMRDAAVIPVNVEYKTVEAPVISTSVI